MSGRPPPGMYHFATTACDAKSMTETDPSRRLDTYRDFVSRETCSPCAPRPVGMNWTSFIATGSITETPILPWFVTKKYRRSGESLTSMGRPPTHPEPASLMLTTSTLATTPDHSVEIIRYEPSALKSRWSAPGHGMPTDPSKCQS